MNPDYDETTVSKVVINARSHRTRTHWFGFDGSEFLIVHKPKLWKEIQSVIADVDAEACKT
jgi:hypothetical protein